MFEMQSALSQSMKYAALGGALAGAATAGSLEELPVVPSGFALSLQELRQEVQPDGTSVLRLRFVMPEIARKDIGYEAVEADFLHLCEAAARPWLTKNAVSVDRIIISLADQELEFGLSNPDATQYFEAFTLENGTCIWEGF